MSHKQSGLWCDLCGKPILSGHWWHIGVSGKPGHCHEECKQAYQRAQIKFEGGAEYKSLNSNRETK